MRFLCARSLTQLLIKKGRGKWPFEALATCFKQLKKGANSNLVNAGKDKSEFSCEILFKKYRALLIYRKSFFYI